MSIMCLLVMNSKGESYCFPEELDVMAIKAKERILGQGIYREIQIIWLNDVL